MLFDIETKKTRLCNQKVMKSFYLKIISRIIFRFESKFKSYL